MELLKKVDTELELNEELNGENSYSNESLPKDNYTTLKL